MTRISWDGLPQIRPKDGLRAGAVMRQLGVSRAKLDRWASDGRLPPDGWCMNYMPDKWQKSRVWRHATVEAALEHVEDWRREDAMKKRTSQHRASPRYLPLPNGAGVMLLP